MSDTKKSAKGPALRKEHDSMGEILVPCDKYWGAQTQRSFENFRIGTEKMPPEVISAFAILKKSAAQANCELGTLPKEKAVLIEKACEEILDGSLDGNFPLAVWQTGSGTQSNMNINEVIAHRGNELAKKTCLHPNDDVNKSQSSNDTCPTAMHIAAIKGIEEHLFPRLDALIKTFKDLEKKHRGIVTTGRTHLQDAVPIAFSQEISGWRTMLERSRDELKTSEKGLLELALGGTAVGTGLNAPKDFDRTVAAYIAQNTGYAFKTAPNKFQAVTMVAVQVMGNDAAIGFAASQGNFQLNVFLPVTIYNFLQSVRLLGDAMESFRIHCALGIKANKAKMKENLHRSLMLVTALTPYIGYDKAAEVAKLAHKKDLSLKEAILELGYMTETDFDAHFHPEKMV